MLQLDCDKATPWPLNHCTVRYSWNNDVSVYSIDNWGSNKFQIFFNIVVIQIRRVVVFLTNYCELNKHFNTIEKLKQKPSALTYGSNNTNSAWALAEKTKVRKTNQKIQYLLLNWRWQVRWIEELPTVYLEWATQTTPRKRIRSENLLVHHFTGGKVVYIYALLTLYLDHHVADSNHSSHLHIIIR